MTYPIYIKRCREKARIVGVGLPLLLVSFVLAACERDENNPKHETERYKKTLFIFLPWTGTDSDKGLYDCFQKNLEGIKSTIENGQAAEDTRTLALLSTSSTSATLYEIAYDRYTRKVGYKTIKQYKGLEMNEKGLRTYIADVKRYSPTPLYAMIMGAHGSGWIPKDAGRRSRSIGGLTMGEQLDIPEIAHAIISNGIKMQFICFDDCYMANIELAFDLKDAVDYLIASTSEVMDTGLPYADVYPFMAAQSPNYKAVTDGFLAYYNSYKYPYGSLSVINCTYSAAMAEILRQLNQSGTSAPSASEVSEQDGDPDTRFYDLADYLRKYNHRLRMAHRDTIEYRPVLERLVPYTVKTPHLYTVYRGWGGAAYDVSAYCGITISDPATASTVIKSKETTAWWKATH